MAQNRIEKITQRFARGLPAGFEVHAGDMVSVRPRHVMTHDNTGAVIPKFRAIGATRVFDPSQPVIALDHDIQNETPENLAKYAAIETFARQHGLAFYPAKSGIAHQLMAEEGFVLPGSLVVGSDSHSNLYGALGAVGTPVVRTDAAAIWATGETWWEIPPVVRVRLEGKLRPGATGKDVIIALIGTFKADEVLNCAIEFEGDGVASLSMDQRMTIANMTTEWGALVGLFPADGVTRRYLEKRAEVLERRAAMPGAGAAGAGAAGAARLTRGAIESAFRDLPQPDAGAFYAKEFTLDLASVTPHVAGPNEVKVITPLPDIEARRVKIDKAYLLSCVNSRLEDIAEAARVLEGKRIAPHVKFYLAAASAGVEAEARDLGYWKTLVDAGAITLPPGCGPCIGLGDGVLQDGEVAISATNRNFKGRMGSRDSFAYLASPAVVAASAAAGYIAAPGSGGVVAVAGTMTEAEPPARAKERIAIREGFPRAIEGGLLLVPKDNLNTDAIYGKDYTYKDDLTPSEMARVAMLNYDPAFQEIAAEGDIMVGGWNFGSGSSREQAATALKHRGIRLIIAGSYSQTYKRNAFNNGFIVIECPPLVTALRDRFKARREPTVRTGLRARVDFESSEITVEGATYSFVPLRDVAQELVALGGFEAVLARRLAGSAGGGPR